eukprot:3743136-Prymnesium_polylepis.1
MDCWWMLDAGGGGSSAACTPAPRPCAVMANTCMYGRGAGASVGLLGEHWAVQRRGRRGREPSFVAQQPGAFA